MEYDLINMKSLDIYLSSLSNDEYKLAKNKIGSPKLMPLISWDIFALHYEKRMIGIEKRADLMKVLSFAKKYNWNNDIHSAFHKNDYEALVITDINQKIIWVNDGFTSMTGYSKKFAINKTPKFLQGTQTTDESRNRIREKIAAGKPFKELIINHRKDKTTYKCEVKIFPLYSENTVHYIAFERKVG